ncbi:hypothetical protein V6Z11_D10G133200 [Gossypium hirsutum]
MEGLLQAGSSYFYYKTIQPSFSRSQSQPLGEEISSANFATTGVSSDEKEKDHLC